MDLVQANSLTGDMFVLGGSMAETYPFIEYMSMEGATYSVQYIPNTLLISITSIAYYAPSNYVVALFETSSFSLGVLSVLDTSFIKVVLSSTIASVQGIRPLVQASSGIFFNGAQVDSSKEFILIGFNILTFQTQSIYGTNIMVSAMQITQTNGAVISMTQTLSYTNPSGVNFPPTMRADFFQSSSGQTNLTWKNGIYMDIAPSFTLGAMDSYYDSGTTYYYTYSCFSSSYQLMISQVLVKSSYYLLQSTQKSIQVSQGIICLNYHALDTQSGVLLLGMAQVKFFGITNFFNNTFEFYGSSVYNAYNAYVNYYNSYMITYSSLNSNQLYMVGTTTNFTGKVFSYVRGIVWKSQNDSCFTLDQSLLQSGGVFSFTLGSPGNYFYQFNTVQSFVTTPSTTIPPLSSSYQSLAPVNITSTFPCTKNPRNFTLNVGAIADFTYDIGQGELQIPLTTMPSITNAQCSDAVFQQFVESNFQLEYIASTSSFTYVLNGNSSWVSNLGTYFADTQFILNNGQYCTVDFNYTISPNCSQNYVQATNISNITYDVGSSNISVFPSWSMFYPSCGNITFDLQVNGSNYSFWQFIYNFSSTNGSFQIVENNLADAGTYTLNLTAYGGNPLFTNTSIFTLTIVNPCTSILISAPTPINTSYEINGSNQTNAFAAFSVNETIPSMCGSMVYNLISESQTFPTVDTSVFQWSTSSPTVYISTLNYSYCYQTQVYGMQAMLSSWTQNNASSLLTVNFTCTCGLSNLVNTVTNNNLTYQLGNSSAQIYLSSFGFSDLSCAVFITYTLTQTSGSITLVASTDYSFNSSTLLLTFYQTFNTSYLGNYTFNQEGIAVMQGQTKTLNNTVTIQIIRGCYSALITPGALYPKSFNYYLQSSIVTIIYDNFILVDPTNSSCTSPITYSLKYYLNGTVQTSIPSFITFNSTNNSISVYTSNSNNMGSYDLALFGNLNMNSYLTLNFTVTVLNQCIPSSLGLPSQSSYYTYIVGSKNLIIPILPFTPNINCNNTINYNSSLINAPVNDTSFIQFIQNTTTYIVYTTNISNIGTYQYEVKAFIMMNTNIAVENNFDFVISVLSPRSNPNYTAPYFTSSLQIIKLYYQSSDSYQLPSTKDDQGYQVQINLGSNTPTFITLDNDIVNINPTGITDLGAYLVGIELQEIGSNLPLTSQYSLKVVITNNASYSTGVSPAAAKYLQMSGDIYQLNGHSINKTQLTGVITASISSIDQFGNVQLVFSTNLLQPLIIDPYLYLQALKITLNKHNGTIIDIPPVTLQNEQTRQLQSLNNTGNNIYNTTGWNITSFSNNQINIHITFQDPQVVSDGSV